MLFVFWYIIARTIPIIKAYIIFIGDKCNIENIIVLIIIDFFCVLNFFSLFNRIYLNNISSYMGPIIPEEINNIWRLILFVIVGFVKRNIIIFNKHAIDMPKDIRGK